MTRQAITLHLPLDRGGAWADAVLDHLRPVIGRLVAAHQLAAPTLVVLRGERPPALVLDHLVVRVPALDQPARMASWLATAIDDHLWPLIVAPALEARGIAAEGSLWLAVAAARGLTVEDLARLADGAWDDTAIAWRLAALEPPVPALLVAGADEREGFDAAALRDAAERAAGWTGLPVPVPAEVRVDLSLTEGMPVLALGAQRLRLRERSALDVALMGAAGRLIDPGLAIALATDSARLPRRLAARALAGDGAVTLARLMVAEHAAGRLPIHLGRLAEAVAGLAPAQ